MTVLKDDEWKSVRAILTTTFTSGKLKSVNTKLKTYKLKALIKLITFKKMSKCMNGCIKNYEKYLEDLVEKDGIFATKL